MSIGFFCAICNINLELFEISESPDVNGTDTLRSVGEGIEREVFHTLMEHFRAESSKWLTPRADGYATVATTLTLAASRFISASRILNMKMFGSIIGLALLRGMSSYPLDPVVINWFINDCDLHSIHPQILGEWHPVLKKTIEDWKNVGPVGNIDSFQPHFATYHDLQVSPTIIVCDLIAHMSWYSRLPQSQTVTKHLMRLWAQTCSTGLLSVMNHPITRS